MPGGKNKYKLAFVLTLRAYCLLSSTWKFCLLSGYSVQTC